MIDSLLSSQLSDIIISIILPFVYFIIPLIKSFIDNNKNIIFYCSRLQPDNTINIIIRNNGHQDLLETDIIKPIRLKLVEGGSIDKVDIIKESPDSNFNFINNPAGIVFSFDYFRRKTDIILQLAISNCKKHEKNDFESDMTIYNGPYKKNCYEEINSNLKFGIHSFHDFVFFIVNTFVFTGLLLMVFSICLYLFLFVYKLGSLLDFRAVFPLFPERVFSVLVIITKIIFPVAFYCLLSKLFGKAFISCCHRLINIIYISKYKEYFK